jgi:hypothetical protein
MEKCGNISSLRHTICKSKKCFHTGLLRIIVRIWLPWKHFAKEQSTNVILPSIVKISYVNCAALNYSKFYLILYIYGPNNNWPWVDQNIFAENVATLLYGIILFVKIHCLQLLNDLSHTIWFTPTNIVIIKNNWWVCFTQIVSFYGF